MDLKQYIADVKDFPEQGIIFRDISPLMANGEAYRYSIKEIVKYAQDLNVDKVVGPEARGFMVGCPVAVELGCGFAMARKKGKLPRETVEVSYGLEYGKATLQLHQDAILPGDKVLVCDDLLATGGTTAATIELVEKLGGEVVGLAFLIELLDLKGRDLIQGYDIFTLMEY
ncbi:MULTISPECIES: adenine phosphoribosyltransferase [Trichococcus]|jgi:adenine phosphoribosyltransferase|uniref:Adenine phosphoribosyltransferase n=4 Tax=Trichococcus TaxID=82802 RepID=A0A1W1IC17_9LACT|nr:MULTISPECIES: adenine phosphoribosyltransferase [Trichococcus]OUL09373.1 adenine phosphoribosyltransferase [Sedimentibacter sp. SX930]TNV68971.1 adenine phosphoribosyltransferase [Trichococcus shcherbakoviae subsp. psychrophilus]SFE24445.1 adenine phosphoribosyltransferase [Trichococcus pasteurii]SLM50451.1 adenine phosphoribosyl transferase [Trichococcus pasteurii]SSB91332.1 adenine phosphoribosyl transferase [Trichococcus pasteurii]